MNIIDAVYAVIDVETTGLASVTDRVVEIACVRLSMTGELKGVASLVNPGIPIPASASAIHHLTDDDVKDAKTLREVLETDVAIECGAIPVAHNAAFDSAFLPSIPGPFLCTMRLAQKLWPDLESYGNQFLRYHLKTAVLDCLRGAAMHRALPDAFVTAALLRHELTEYLSRATTDEQRTVEHLMQWVAEPVLLSRCKFGKHKGMLWQDVPRSYLAWMVSPGGMTDMDGDLRYTVEHYLGN